jgi:hypothetical protein
MGSKQGYRGMMIGFTLPVWSGSSFSVKCGAGGKIWLILLMGGGLMGLKIYKEVL